VSSRPQDSVTAREKIITSNSMIHIDKVKNIMSNIINTLVENIMSRPMPYLPTQGV